MLSFFHNQCTWKALLLSYLRTNNTAFCRLVLDFQVYLILTLARGHQNTIHHNCQPWKSFQLYHDSSGFRGWFLLVQLLVIPSAWWSWVYTAASQRSLTGATMKNYCSAILTCIAKKTWISRSYLCQKT